MFKYFCAVFACIAMLAAAPAEARDYPVRLVYAAPADVLAGAPSMALASVADEREHDADWLGAIRGGYGNPLKVLRTEGATVAEVVAQGIRDALAARSLAAEPAAHRLVVRIVRFDCNQFFPKEAHITLAFRLEDAATGALLYEGNTEAGDVGAGIGGGIFTPVEPLRAMTEGVMNAGINQMLDDPGLRAALAAAPVVAAAPAEVVPVAETVPAAETAPAPAAAN